MKTAIVGAGRGCRSLLEFILSGGLTELQLEVRLVCDEKPEAPGVLYAKERGIRTCTHLEEVLLMPGLEVVLELTGRPEVSDDIYHRLPPGVRVIDHRLARMFWDLLHAQRRLREEREGMEAILDSIPDIVVLMDGERRICTVNRAFTEYTGLSRADARGRPCHQALCGQAEVVHTTLHPCPFDEVVATGRRTSLVQVKQRANGKDEHFELTMTPITGPAGELQIVEALHPITERVRLRREVEAFAQRFREFIDSAHDLISIKDLDGRYQVVNTATAEFLGHPIEECIGKPLRALGSPAIAGIVERHDREVIQRKQAITYEETFFIGEQEVHFSTIRFPLFDYFGDVDGVCTISRDVTREKRLQRELVNADKLAAIGKLAAGVAHEINNPLTGILAFAEDLLEDAADDDPEAEDYRVIVRETLRCREIVRNLLDFARQSSPRIRRADLNQVVERALALVERQAAFRDIVIARNLGDGLPPILGDAHQLQQVVLNLVVNAAEVMTDGGCVTVETGVAEDERTCWLTVADDGPGVAEGDLDKIFEPFYTTKKTTHGLGLAVSWGIVQRHGGRIDVERQEEGGARFRVVLPSLGFEESESRASRGEK